MTEYRSDYDILVVTRRKDTAEDVNLWYDVDQKFIDRRTLVNISCHSINEVNTNIGARSYLEHFSRWCSGRARWARYTERIVIPRSKCPLDR